jgi:serine/threonine protein kinase
MLKKLGQGANGCVYNGIVCENDDKIKTKLGENYIVKVLDKKKGSEEREEYIKLNKMMDKIVNPGQYFIVDQEDCINPAFTRSFTEKVICSKGARCTINNPFMEDCSALKGKDEFNYLTYENGGDSLSKLLKYDKGNLIDFYIPIFVSFLNVFKGVNELNKNDLFIFDLKPDNIVFNTETGVFKLIDLGGVKFFKRGVKLDEETETNIVDLKLGQTPSFVAPEMLVKKFTNGKGENMETKLFYAAPNALGGGPNFVILTKNSDGTKWILKTDARFLQYIDIGDIDTIDYDYYLNLSIRKQYEKNDIFALGIILLIIYNDILEEQKYEPTIDITSLKLEELVETVIKPMLRLNIKDRVDSKKALKNYAKWLVDSDFIEKGITSLKLTESPQNVSRSASTAFSKPIERSLSMLTPSPTPSPPLSPLAKKTTTGGRKKRKTMRYRKKKIHRRTRKY